ncbi:MAG: AAA family ATPase [Desulfobacterales bacterium]|nr:AAA family ATPase [Desulfobacterales bacterium]
MPDTRVHKVLETGRAEIGKTMVIDGKQRIVARIPLKHNDRTIGAVGKVMFWHTDQLEELYKLVSNLEGKIEKYKDELNQIYGNRYSFDNIIGNSGLIRHAKELALDAAKVLSPVLITGESGTGKELFAHAIHQASKRKHQPFIRINCACIPQDLIESELFGYEPGSFTGANKKGKIGKFEQADKGTIFLDEIGDMPYSLQMKLMRVLQEKEIEKIGGKPKQIDFRLITATNRDLESMMRKGKFRLDLYYRINVININLPPLEKLKEDVPLLVHHFIDELKNTMPKDVTSVSDHAMAALQNHSWPGNIRELRNVIERSLISCKGSRIEFNDLPPTLGDKNIPVSKDVPLAPLKERLGIAEKQIISETLKQSGNNRTIAAKILGIHRTGLHNKIKKYGL